MLSVRRCGAERPGIQYYKIERNDTMAISGIGSNYNNVYEGTYAAQKNDAVKKAEARETASAQAGEAKDAREKATSDYYSYLQ